jgi:hypothetical protein
MGRAAKAPWLSRMIRKRLKMKSRQEAVAEDLPEAAAARPRALGAGHRRAEEAAHRQEAVQPEVVAVDRREAAGAENRLQFPVKAAQKLELRPVVAGHQRVAHRDHLLRPALRLAVPPQRRPLDRPTRGLVAQNHRRPMPLPKKRLSSRSKC